MSSEYNVCLVEFFEDCEEQGMSLEETCKAWEEFCEEYQAQNEDAGR